MTIKIPYQTVVLIGKTGCGKGTQSELLGSALAYSVFSTGDKVRKTGAMPTPLGRKIQEIQVKGWVPEWLASYFLVKALLEEYVEDGLVFESVARKPEEAVKLHEIHEMLGREYIVVHLEIADDLVVERMLARSRDEADTADNIAKRLKAFYDETQESINIFASYDKVRTVDANQEPDKVFEDIIKVIKS